MIFKSVFKSTANKAPKTVSDAAPEVPSGLLRKCGSCKATVFAEDVKKNYYICPECGNYFHVHAYRRIDMTVDKGSFEEWDKDLTATNPLRYKGYKEKLEEVRQKTELSEAIVTGKASINGIPVVIGACDGRFLMASMGQAVGEKIANAVERATDEGLPVILFACSGGARMQEGIVSLMQMAKTSAALKRHSDAGLLYISVLTDPTTGGVTASFAMLGDIILAEPKALIGFAGQRVIEQTIGQKLPKGFQRAEFLLEHGFIDKIVNREDMRDTLTDILKLHGYKENSKIDETDINNENNENIENTDEAADEAEAVQPLFTDDENPKKGDAWENVTLARSKTRPTAGDYIDRIFDDFIELHGDRYFGDDPVVIGGIGFLDGVPVTVLGQEKGRGTKDSISRNFGMVSPEGYRKSMRLMKQAEKFGRPVIFFVDTPGAFCGIEAEERGQGEAIARNLYELSSLKVPVLSIVIGEGGSGGALAFAVADEVWMFEHAIYSVLSPEGFASILWKDGKKAKEAASVMKLTARDLKKLGIIEYIIPEAEPIDRDNMDCTAEGIKREMIEFVKKHSMLSPQEIADGRYERFRHM